MKIFTFLKRLSTKELNHFQQFLAADFFNKRDDVRKLFEFWKMHQRNLQTEEAFSFVFPEKKFNPKDWHLLTSRLFKLGELFLATRELIDTPVLQKQLTGNVFRKKKMIPFFQTVYQESKKLLQKQKLRDEKWLQQYFYIENEYYDFIASHNRKHRTNLQEVSDGLDQYFFANKLKTACLALSRRGINQEQYEIHLIQDVVTSIEQEISYLEIPAINVYYYCYKAITDTQNEQWFTHLRESITQFQECFPLTERRDIFLLATNYCIRRLNQGKSIYIREALELYRLSLKAGYLLEDGFMPESTFSNIVSLSAKLGEYDWAEDFVLTNKSFLKPAFQEPLYHYNLGKLYYERGNLHHALTSLIQVNTNANFLLIGTRILQLKIYFETKEIDALESLLDSFKVYLHRHKNLGYHKKNYELFIFYVKKMLDLPSKNKQQCLKLKNEVIALEGFTEKKWVIEKIDHFV